MVAVAQRRGVGSSLVQANMVGKRKLNGQSVVRGKLAQKFQQNWLAQNGTGETSSGALDDSLTSLNWLQNLNILLPSDTPPPSPSPSHNSVPITLTQATEVVMPSRATSINPNSILNCRPCSPPKNKSDPRLVFPDLSAPQNDGIDYKNNAYVKPPYSYATLICMSMRDSKKQKMTLSAIYQWIMDNFMYYRIADPSWQNSIRHNLSLNKCFQKVPRRKDEPGKGGFWRINPDFAQQMERDANKKRRFTPTVTNPLLTQISAFSLKRIKQEPDDDDEHSLMSPIDLSVVKMEPELDSSFTQHNGALKGDFIFGSLLSQDIEVEGVKIKTEDIIDDPKQTTEMERQVLNMTPSDSGSDFGLDELFPSDLNVDQILDNPIDQISLDPLNLSINGVGVKVPDWWGETGFVDPGFISPDRHSGLSTPVAPSPIGTEAWDNLDNLVGDDDLDSLLDLTG